MPLSCKCPKRWPDAFATSSFPRALVDPDEIKGHRQLVKEAVNLKFLNTPLTPQQLAELIQIPPRKK